jgi:hypothetical protein
VVSGHDRTDVGGGIGCIPHPDHCTRLVIFDSAASPVRPVSNMHIKTLKDAVQTYTEEMMTWAPKMSL